MGFNECVGLVKQVLTNVMEELDTAMGYLKDRPMNAWTKAQKEKGKNIAIAVKVIEGIMVTFNRTLQERGKDNG
jgi:hypothetical protein